MKLFRSVLFWCHLSAGVSAGLVVLVMSVTGVLLTYERQIALWVETRHLDAAPPTPAARRLSVDELLSRVRAARPEGRAQSLTLRRDPAAPVAVTTSANGTLYVHPYTGAVVGSESAGVRGFFRGVTNWHRWLAMSGDQRATGRAITGASNLLFLFIVCSGVYLWFPRSVTWTQVTQVIWFRRRLPSKARDFNWHNVIGFWSSIPLVIVVASGVVISYPWASNLVYRAMGEAPPAPVRPAGGGPGGTREPGERGRPAADAARSPSSTPRADAPTFEGLEALVARSARQVDDWRILTIRVPPTVTAPVAITIDRGDGGQPQKRGQLTLDRATGAVIRWEPFASNTPGRRLRMMLRFAHTGEVAGFLGQTIAGLVSLGGSVLVYTGLALSCRRFLAWRRRRSASRVTLDAPASARRAEAVE